MKKRFLNKLREFPTLYLLGQLVLKRDKALKGSFENYQKRFIKNKKNTKLLDIGCGDTPKNHLNAETVFGIDRVGNKQKNIIGLNLNKEKLPFANETFDYITAYDVLEHIAKYDPSVLNESPIINLLNEIYRVLKKDGVFISHTPVYPYMSAFQDPTHNNIMTKDTFNLYFSVNKLDVASFYGIESEFTIIEQRQYGSHQIIVAGKK